jgi:hypothetical protein
MYIDENVGVILNKDTNEWKQLKKIIDWLIANFHLCKDVTKEGKGMQ